MKMKATLAPRKLTAEEAERAVHNAQAALEALKNEKGGLPERFAEAMKRGDVPAAVTARERLAVIDLYVAAAEVDVLRARVGQVEVAIEMQRTITEAKVGAADEHRAKVDQARRAGSTPLEMRHLQVDLDELAAAANASQVHLGRLQGTHARRTAELDQKLAALGSLL